MAQNLHRCEQARRAIVDLPSMLYRHRTTHGYSLRYVAEAAGVSFSTVMRVEDGAQFTNTTATRLLAWLAREEAEL